MNVALFIVSNFFVFAAAVMITDMLFNKQGRWLRFLSVLCFYAAAIVFIHLATGLAGGFTVCMTSMASAALFIVTGAIYGSIHHGQLLQGKSRWLWLAPVILIAGFPAGWIGGRYVLQGTHFCEDDLTYHATTVAHWYLEKTISAGPQNYHYHVPLNAELFGLWFFLPFGRDGMVFLSGPFWMVTACTAAIVLMQNMGVDRKWFGPVLFSFFCCQVIVHQATWTFTAVDLAGPVMVLCAAAFLSSKPLVSSIRQWPYILSAGLCAGFAFGTKVPFVTVFGVLAIWVLLVNRDKISIRLGHAILFCIAAAAIGSYWYIRNLVLTGNPVFPGELGPFKGPLTREIQWGTTLWGHAVKSGFNFSFILEVLRRHLAWPAGVFMLSVAGLLTGAVFACRKTEFRRTVGLLLCVAAVMLATYPTMPFSGQNNGPNASLSVALRFIIGPVLVGLILFSLLLNRQSFLRWVWYCFYIAGLSWAICVYHNAIQVVAGAAALLWFLLYSFQLQWQLPQSTPVLLYLLLLLPTGLWGITQNFPRLQAKTNRRLYESTVYMSINMCSAWQQIESLPAGSHVMVFGSFAYAYYPLFGRHLQFYPCPSYLSTATYEPLYRQWNADPDPEHVQWWGSIAITNPQKWIANLVLSGADYTLVQWGENQWTDKTRRPEPCNILQQSGVAEEILSGSNWVLWKIKK